MIILLTHLSVGSKDVLSKPWCRKMAAERLAGPWLSRPVWWARPGGKQGEHYISMYVHPKNKRKEEEGGAYWQQVVLIKERRKHITDLTHSNVLCTGEEYPGTQTEENPAIMTWTVGGIPRLSTVLITREFGKDLPDFSEPEAQTNSNSIIGIFRGCAIGHTGGRRHLWRLILLEGYITYSEITFFHSAVRIKIQNVKPIRLR